jgi:hypothetical protein
LNVHHLELFYYVAKHGRIIGAARSGGRQWVAGLMKDEPR